MRPIGFSTGTLSQGDVRIALRMLRGKAASAVELSALRESELTPLMATLDALDLSQFSRVSVHAPSRFVDFTEREVAELLRPVFDRKWHVIVHPEVCVEWSTWQDYGEMVCIENMAKRKAVGCTAGELARVFGQLPKASLCFDIGHARKVDPTMCEAWLILQQHGERVRQLHVSDVNCASRHEPLNLVAEAAFGRVAHLVSATVPIIMETPVDEQWIACQMDRAIRALSRRKRGIITLQ